MSAAAILWLALATSAAAFSVKVQAFDRRGRALGLKELEAFLGRADAKPARDLGLLLRSNDGGAEKPVLLEGEGGLVLAWQKLDHPSLSLPWPAAGDGFSTVWIDRGGQGLSDGDAITLNDEIGATQWRNFKEAFRERTTSWSPSYKPSREALRLVEKAKDSAAKAIATKSSPARAAAWDAAFAATALASEKSLFEHGVQLAKRQGASARFGLTLDERLLDRLAEREEIAERLKRLGVDWVRLVFRSNPDDFVYARPGSLSEYDAVVDSLRGAGLKILGCVLDSGQWPSLLNAPVYAERTRRLVLHYRGRIGSWEVGSEINGDWLGGAKRPLPLDDVFRIYSEAAATVKSIDPGLETVATLYWWDGTAPDDAHSLFGWLRRYGARGFGKDLDVLSLSLQPEDNPVGTAFERIFARTRELLPGKKLMLGSFGYGDEGKVDGYWWLDANDIDGARKDLLILYTGASCAPADSLCGGFYWRGLEDVLPTGGKNRETYDVLRRTLKQAGR